MKKRLLSIILASACVMSLVACGGESSKPAKEYGPEAMWVLQTDFGEDLKEIEGTIGHPDLVLPIDLENLDSFSAPYHVYFNEGGRATETCQTASEVVVLEDSMISNGVLNDITLWVNSEKGEGRSEDLDPDNLNGLDAIFIRNYGEEKLSVKECYEQNWWCIQLDNEEDVVNSLQLTIGEEFNAIGNAIALKLGAPDYLAPLEKHSEMSESEYYTFMEAENSIEYTLIWEYKDYVITIHIQDFANEYADEEIRIKSVQYYTPECFDKIKEERYPVMFDMP